MNRADKMLSVLKDGRTYSRLEILERVGWMMTNNAAAELRKRGLQIEHRKERGNDVYQLVVDALESGPVSLPVTPPVGIGTSAAGPDSSASLSRTPANSSPSPFGGDPHAHRDSEDALTLFDQEVAA